MRPVKPTARFAAYEISPCILVRAIHVPGKKRDECYQAVENLKGLNGWDRLGMIFTLYGENPDGTVEALVDRSTWDDAARVYEAITGCRVPRKLRNTRMKHLPAGAS